MRILNTPTFTHKPGFTKGYFNRQSTGNSFSFNLTFCKSLKRKRMLKSKNIYLADDDRDDVEFFMVALEDICSRCALNVSENGEELIHNLQAASTPPDIIFIDVNMPKIDGLGALETIRKMPALDAVPVIVYSTSSNRLSISRAYENRANYYFIKPGSFESLKAHIKQLLAMDWKYYTIPKQLNQFILNASFS